MEQQQQVGSCIICKNEKKAGIRICDQLICEDCEAEIVHTDVYDARYPFFIHQMKQIWYKRDA